MKIIKATYGGIDCTYQVSSRINNNRLIIKSDNLIIGDPKIGEVKYLEIDIENNGVLFSEKVREGDTFVFPKITNKRLGVWYSNDMDNHPSIKCSLDSINKAKGSNVDIVTCPWRHILENPFYEVISWNKSSSHLNQLLQILQCIYTALSHAEYEYVSFLEHDVMYPEGYFDYEDFDKGVVLINMNYGGINSEGWQKRNQDDQPMHQMTMHISDAINHFNNILRNAILTNSGNIENDSLKRINWECKNQAIHINHGKHFTSHFNIYDKYNIYEVHPYWGNHDNFKYLFIK